MAYELEQDAVLPYCVTKMWRPDKELKLSVLARFKTLHDASFFARNVYKVAKDEVESIRVYDSDAKAQMLQLPLRILIGNAK